MFNKDLWAVFKIVPCRKQTRQLFFEDYLILRCRPLSIHTFLCIQSRWMLNHHRDSQLGTVKPSGSHRSTAGSFLNTGIMRGQRLCHSRIKLRITPVKVQNCEQQQMSQYFKDKLPCQAYVRNNETSHFCLELSKDRFSCCCWIPISMSLLLLTWTRSCIRLIVIMHASLDSGFYWTPRSRMLPVT